jgi:hypothetical protein
MTSVALPPLPVLKLIGRGFREILLFALGKDLEPPLSRRLRVKVIALAGNVQDEVGAHFIAPLVLVEDPGIDRDLFMAGGRLRRRLRRSSEHDRDRQSRSNQQRLLNHGGPSFGQTLPWDRRSVSLPPRARAQSSIDEWIVFGMGTDIFPPF